MAALTLSALAVQAQTLVYQDFFDNDTLATNAGTGGGATNLTLRSNHLWSDNGDLTYSGANQNFQNRAIVFSDNVVQSSGGFELAVEYTMTGQANLIANMFSFGLIREDTDVAAYTEWNPFGATASVYSIGVNLIPSQTTNKGLNFTDGSAVTILDTSGTNVDFVEGVSTPVVMTVVPDGAGGADWSYSINGITEASGNIPVFDFNQGYRFLSYAQDNEFSRSIQLVSLSAFVSDPNYWTGVGGATWDQSTTVNFTTNDKLDPLAGATFAEALEIQNRVNFGDTYFDSGTAVDVTQGVLTVAAGGVSAPGGTLDFSNNLLDYEISGEDEVGITGTTNLLVSGGGSVTLNSPNTHTGLTTVSGGSELVLKDGLALQYSRLSGNTEPIFDESVTEGVFTVGGFAGSLPIVLENNAESPAPIELIVGNGNLDSNGAPALTGSGSLTKIGSGTLMLGGSGSTYTGETLVQSGTLHLGLNGGPGLSPSSPIVLGDSTVNDDVILRFGQATVSGPSITIPSDHAGLASLHSNANSTVEIAEINLGSPGSDGRDLTIAQLAVGSNFSLHGVIQDPEGMTPGTAGTVSIGLDGDGDVHFHGANTYSGDTLVETGHLFIEQGGAITMYPTTNGTSNQVVGAFGFGGIGNLTFNGGLNIDLTNADATMGNKWVLIDAEDLASVNYGASFVVTSPTGDFAETSTPGVWVKPNGLFQWIYTESDHTLTYLPGDYNFWTGTTGSTWDQSTTANFSNNSWGTPASVVTFNVATLLSNSVRFADAYWNNTTATPVTEFNVGVNGPVETGLVEFINSAANPYVISSVSSGTGISGATNVQIRGGGEVTLLGDHTHTGTTTIATGSTLNIGDGVTDGFVPDSPIVNHGAFHFNAAQGLGSIYSDIANEGTLTFNAGMDSGTSFISGAVSGGGALEKLGPDVLRLEGLTDAMSGPVTVSGGTLTFVGISAVPSYHVESGATLEFAVFNGGGGVTQVGNTTFTGGGTVLNTGDAALRWGAGSAVFALDSGALIDVQAGNFVGGSNNNDIWTGNLSGLNVEAFASFGGAEANIEVDELTGAGTITSGFRTAAITSYTAFTFGVDDGSGTFDGVLANNANHVGSYTKVGSGTQTLTGMNTYTGFTTVEEGALVITSTGGLTFAPAANGVINQVRGVPGGTGSFSFEGTVVFNLGGANSSAGNSWVLIDDTDLTAGFDAVSVESTLGFFNETSPGVWTLDTLGNLWTFTESTRTLTVEAGTPGYDSWISGFTVADTSPNGDSDNDSIENVLEYVLNGNPEIADPGILPTADASGENFVFTFQRLALSATDTTQTFQYSTTDMAAESWIDIGIAPTPAAEVSISAPVDGVETVTVTISKSVASDGKIFGRLSALNNPS
ncbi:beta strand repeat-containing protein [Haloferula chungangensis]|uniref:Beta strand repeat-containing protein n=1 Tax=Haloferula chungangensis TaxID=1048331 RepID=A0ABW2L753_9BACT